MKTRQPIIRPIVLSILMTLPIGVGIILWPALVVQEIWREVREEVLDVEYQTSVSSARQLGFLLDGTPVIKTYSDSHGVKQRVLHLDGTPFPEDAQPGTRGWTYFRASFEPWVPQPFLVDLRRISRKSSFNDPLIPLHLWHWETFRANRWHWEKVRNDRAGMILVGVSHRSEEPILYCSASGFSTITPSPDDCFLDVNDRRSYAGNILPYAGNILLRSADKLIRINLAERTVATICEINPRAAWNILKINKEELLFAVYDDGTLKVYDEHSGVVLDHSVPGTWFSPRLCTIFEQVATSDVQFIVTHTLRSDAVVLPYNGVKKRVTVLATWFDHAGTITRTLEFENSDQVEVAPPNSNVVYFIDQFIEQAGPGFAMPSPVVMCTALLTFMPYSHSLHSPDIDFVLAVQISLARNRYAIPISAAISLLCTIACWRQQKRLGIPWTKTWVVFIFLFGLPAWIAWKAHRHWPSADVARVSVADFVGPEVNGLEIR
jgi:hypothetical protein